MTGNNDRARATEIVAQALLGHSISGFSVSDWWQLYLGDYILQAHDVASADEAQLNQWYQANYPPFTDCVDQELISKATIVTAYQQRLITEVILDDEYNLTLIFENGRQLILPTNTDIVDWQWALNTSGNDPYMDCLVGCFWKGEIEIHEGETPPADS